MSCGGRAELESEASLDRRGTTVGTELSVLHVFIRFSCGPFNPLIRIPMIFAEFAKGQDWRGFLEELQFHE